MTDTIWAALIGAIALVIAALIKTFKSPRDKGKKVDEENGFFELREATKEAIAEVYRAVLERNPDPKGLKKYGKQLQSENMALRMIVKDEAKTNDKQQIVI